MVCIALLSLSNGLSMMRITHYDNGRFIFVNSRNKQAKIKVIFPSKKEREFFINKEDTYSFNEKDYGEGNLKFIVNDKEVECSNSHIVQANQIYLFLLTENKVIGKILPKK